MMPRNALSAPSAFSFPERTPPLFMALAPKEAAAAAGFSTRVVLCAGVPCAEVECGVPCVNRIRGEAEKCKELFDEGDDALGINRRADSSVAFTALNAAPASTPWCGDEGDPWREAG